MRLNRWVRIGILFSVAWVIGAAIYTHNETLKTATFWSKMAYDSCTSSKKVNDTDLSSCDAKRVESIRTWMATDNGSIAFNALAPIPFAWLAVFILVYVIRVQIVGLRAVIPWSTLSRPKKWFAGFCFLSSAFALLLVIVVALNTYVDSKVPVGIAGFQDFDKNDGSVTVTGTWIRTDLADTDDSIVSPLQTSKIECDKAANTCVEAQAHVSGATLMTDLVKYDIKSWTPDAVVMVRDDLCATEIFTIDLNTKAVTGAGHLTNQGNGFCSSNKDEKDTWSYQLANGFRVYWELRQKARPWPLRVIYSLFGN